MGSRKRNMRRVGMLRTRIFLLTTLSILLFVTSCSKSGIKPIEDAKEIQFIVIDNGIAVKSGNIKRDEIKKVIELHNNATFISEVKENILDETVPMEEELSNSNIRIQISPQKSVYIVYKGESIFKVIHENEKMAYNITSLELLEFIKENKDEK
jgi:uncharacterized Fe-S cluster-containing radical SAM superfamily protein